MKTRYVCLEGPPESDLDTKFPAAPLTKLKFAPCDLQFSLFVQEKKIFFFAQKNAAKALRKARHL